jgi:OOP family OmpA-OmpF porin
MRAASIALGAIALLPVFGVAHAGWVTQDLAADAPGITRAVIRSGSVTLDGVNFAGGTVALEAGSEWVLAEVLEVLEDHTDWRFEVQAHTGDEGTAAANLALSRERAGAVVGWLVKNGVDGSRLVPKGYGDSAPVAGRTTDAGRAKNRRIELKKLNEE